MAIDWNRHIATVIDLGSESIETKVNRIMLRGAALLIFILFLWAIFIKR